MKECSICEKTYNTVIIFPYSQVCLRCLEQLGEEYFDDQYDEKQ